MASWRDSVIRSFISKRAKITVVADPDGLLRDPQLAQRISEQGFLLIQFSDPITFRYDFETRIRNKWDTGDPIELVVFFALGNEGFNELPADILNGASRLSFNLAELFNLLSYEVVTQLESIYFESLFDAQSALEARTRLDEKQTLGFILRHVFQTEPAVLKDVPDLLRVLCERHYGKISLPRVLDQYFISELRRNEKFKPFPLEQIVPSAAAFWEFLSERWARFVSQVTGPVLNLTERPQRMNYAGPELLPFGHDSFRVYLDDLFSAGLLQRLTLPAPSSPALGWMRCGMEDVSSIQPTPALLEAMASAEKLIPPPEALPKHWLDYAMRFAAIRRSWSEASVTTRAKCEAPYSGYHSSVNSAFWTWLSKYYGGLYNYPPSSPLMVHHIPGYINYQLKVNQAKRMAFILVDGLAVDQWGILRDAIRSQGVDALIEEKTLLAWVPSITPISRQAAYSGKIPRHFGDSLHRTDRDEAGWRQFWGDHELQPQQIAFAAVAGESPDIAEINSLITDKTVALGVTLFKVDKIMHGMQLGEVGMSSQVRVWAEQGFFAKLVRTLLSQNFEIVISADHGNTEAIGVGVPKEGKLSDKGGERCRIYADQALSKSCLASHPQSLSWSSPGLPEDINVLLAPAGEAFSPKGLNLLCHGGATIEEVCVPFIKITPR